MQLPARALIATVSRALTGTPKRLKMLPKMANTSSGPHGADSVRPQLIMKDLEADLRKVMAPATGSSLRESKRNVLKDFVHIAGPLGVTHFLILTATQNASYLRIAKTPRVRSS